MITTITSVQYFFIRLLSWVGFNEIQKSTVTVLAEWFEGEKLGFQEQCGSEC